MKNQQLPASTYGRNKNFIKYGLRDCQFYTLDLKVTYFSDLWAEEQEAAIETTQDVQKNPMDQVFSGLRFLRSVQLQVRDQHLIVH